MDKGGRSTKRNPGAREDGGAFIPVRHGNRLLAGVSFLTRFDRPIPADVDGRLELLLGLFKQIPRGWRLYADKVLMKQKVILHVYEGVFVGKTRTVGTGPDDFDRRAIVAAMKAPLSKAASILPQRPFAIFVFPRFFSTLSVDAHCLVDRAIHLFIDPNGDWRSLLPSTLCHEYFHLVYKSAHPGSHTAGQTMTDEGLGMHFAEEITGYRYERDQKLTDRAARAWLRKNRRLLEKSPSDAFYGKRLQPRGFDCGYLMVRTLLGSARSRKDNWRAIARMPAEAIFRLAWDRFVGRGRT